MANISDLSNSTATATTGSKETYRSLAEIILGSLTFIVIIFMTISGNIMVIISIYTYRPLKKVQNYFLVSLASADLTVASLVMPFHLVKFLAGGRWLFGLIFCQLWLTFDILLCTSSILNLCAIAIDRYWAITQPLEYAQKRTARFVSIMIAIVWVLSALISIPPLIGWNDWSTTTLLDKCELTTQPAFVVFSASGSFYLPLIVMTTVYIKIFFAARKRIKKNIARSALTKYTRTSNEPSTRGRGESSPLVDKDTKFREEVEIQLVNNAGPDPQAPDTPNQAVNNGTKLPPEPPKPSKSRSQSVQLTSVTFQQQRREKISVSKEKKAAKTLAVIMGVFVLCWLPFFLMYVILPFCPYTCFLHPKVVEAITWLGYINSAINPVIYTIFNMDFRRAFERFLCPKVAQARRVR